MDEETVKAHREADEAGDSCYRDPGTGLWVLTASYLEERGYCCHNDCRHCPYDEAGKLKA